MKNFVFTASILLFSLQSFAETNMENLPLDEGQANNCIISGKFLQQDVETEIARTLGVRSASIDSISGHEDNVVLYALFFFPPSWETVLRTITLTLKDQKQSESFPNSYLEYYDKNQTLTIDVNYTGTFSKDRKQQRFISIGRSANAPVKEFKVDLSQVPQC